MIIQDKITVKNYKCFGDTGGEFEQILPINIIIGKNNSGKSSLIDLVRFLVNKNQDFFKIGRFNSNSEIIIEHTLKNSEISRVFPEGTSGGGIPARNFYEYGKQFIDKKYIYRLNQNAKQFVSIDTKYVEPASKMINSLASMMQVPLEGKTFCNISAERDIIPEMSDKEIVFTPNGTGATNIIQLIINRTNRNSQLIEQKLLKELNTIINPDIKFSRILVQLNENDYWELYFENLNKDSIALSKMGSGIKTILLVLLNLIVRPEIEKQTPSSYVFAFEELENNLHPSLQRRLYNYINNYSLKNSTYFFLTTHSNVVIDAFGSSENTQLIHVLNDGEKSTTITISSYSETKNILNDLGIKASDILQSNGVIWVEGPSDRIYINKWINLLRPDLKEGLHYSIMFYGGRLLSNLSFDFEWFNENVIPLLKINKNAFVIIDRDGKSITTKINETKKRISNEIGANNSWITKGREIENYLSDETITKWLLKKHKYKVVFKNNKDVKLEDSITNSSSKIKLKYNLKKTLFANEIIEYVDNNSLEILDLEDKLNSLITEIDKWNR